MEQWNSKEKYEYKGIKMRKKKREAIFAYLFAVFRKAKLRTFIIRLADFERRTSPRTHYNSFSHPGFLPTKNIYSEFIQIISYQSQLSYG